MKLTLLIISVISFHLSSNAQSEEKMNNSNIENSLDKKELNIEMGRKNTRISNEEILKRHSKNNEAPKSEMILMQPSPIKKD